MEAVLILSIIFGVLGCVYSWSSEDPRMDKWGMAGLITAVIASGMLVQRMV